MEKENIMATGKMNSLIWKLGIPMIVSLVLQALYNIVDTAFVINMDPVLGAKANLALTYAFPIQIFMIAVGVGTGIGINALLSRFLGEGNREGIRKAVGTSFFLVGVIFILFLLIGLFLAEPFVKMQSADADKEVIEMGRDYLFIVCVFSLGNVGFTVFERFLQSTGKTAFSMIAQVSGALTNIFLDWLFIYPCGWGIRGAAIATVVGQFVAWGLAILFNFTLNREITTSLKYLKPDARIIGGIYQVGWSAAIMQALLSLMMLGMNLVFKNSRYDAELLQGTFGIYYKVQQIPLFACFGMSNALITITSFTEGTGNRERLRQIYKFGLLDTVIVGLVITAVFEALANPIAMLFGLAGGNDSKEIVSCCATAIRIAAVSYVFMGFTVGMQGILQGFRGAIRPLILSLLRLVVLVFPVAYLFTLNKNVTVVVWFTFIIAEAATALIAVPLSYKELKSRVTE